jgi:hypothetical protein
LVIKLTASLKRIHPTRNELVDSKVFGLAENETQAKATRLRKKINFQYLERVYFSPHLTSAVKTAKMSATLPFLLVLLLLVFRHRLAYAS